MSTFLRQICFFIWIFDPWWKGKQANQGITSLSQICSTRKNLYHICHHKQSPTMGFLSSILKHHLEANSWPQTCHSIFTKPSNTAIIEKLWDSFERPQNFRIPLTTSPTIGNRRCSHHCPPELLVPPYLRGPSYNLASSCVCHSHCTYAYHRPHSSFCLCKWGATVQPRGLTELL